MGLKAAEPRAIQRPTKAIRNAAARALRAESAAGLRALAQRPESLPGGLLPQPAGAGHGCGGSSPAVDDAACGHEPRHDAADPQAVHAQRRRQFTRPAGHAVRKQGEHALFQGGLVRRLRHRPRIPMEAR